MSALSKVTPPLLLLTKTFVLEFIQHYDGLPQSRYRCLFALQLLCTRLQ